jgi:hypothetical protein
MLFLGFSNHKKWSSEARNFEVINGLQHISEKGWSVVRSASLANVDISKKETVIAPPQNFDSE